MRKILIVIVLFIANLASAQDVEMADSFRGEGKIYVVVAVMILILVGIVAFLLYLEKKIKKLEE